LINSDLLHIRNRKSSNLKGAGLATIKGVKKIDGMISLKVKIFKIEKHVNIFVVDKENFNYDFLIGLDCIREFKLQQNENLQITQTIQSRFRDEEKNKTNLGNS